MKKVYKLQDLDCANCAAKMERAIGKLPEIKQASVNFMTQRMVLEFEDGASEQDALQKVLACIRKVEPDCSVILP